MRSICVQIVGHDCAVVWPWCRCRRFWIALVIATLTVTLLPLRAQETSRVDRSSAKDVTPKEATLQFSFEGTPWREVVKWLASESDLALHVGDFPTGSFTYSDPNLFTEQEAIGRVNLFLLSEGYTLVRRGNLLSLINLNDSRNVQQLNALAKLVTVEQLDEMKDHEVVKCIFALGKLKAEDAVEELAALSLMTQPAVLSKTNQLMITDTVANLATVKAILSAFEPSTLDNGTVMKNFALKHVEAEDILLVVRPHLGLATGEMIGIDVSLSADLQGKNIFVTGVEDKVKLIEGLIESLDKPKESLSLTDGKSELRSHIIEGGNVRMVHSVLQTLLAGETVRLSTDEVSGNIVALATPEIQETIAQTVAQLQASEAVFEIIQLKSIDPYFALSLLEEMLDLYDLEYDDYESTSDSGNRSRESTRNEVSKVDIPKIDADPGNMRLFVRAKKPQLDRIKQIVAELDKNASIGDSDDKIRLFPLKGKPALQVLETACKFWREENLVILFPSMSLASDENTQRVVAEESIREKPKNAPPFQSPMENSRVLAGDIQSKLPAIRCQLTPRGLMLQSDDTQALNQFYKHLRTIAGPVDSTPSTPVVFYLKYAKADQTIRMLAELLDGGDSATEGEAGTLINGYVSSPAGTFLGSLVTTSDGTTTMTAGTITVVVDSRLNRLIVQGTVSDIERVENYLKIIDKDSSITSIETYGSSHVIELTHTKANVVADAIRQVFVGRVLASTSAGQPNQQGTAQQAQRKPTAEKSENNQEQSKGKKAAAAKTPSGKAAGSFEPKMTIAVHEPSNSLIVTCPNQMFEEVERLVNVIDSRSKQTVEVIATSNSEVYQELLRQVQGQSISSGSKQQPSTSRSPTRRPPPTASPMSSSSPSSNSKGRQ